MIQGIVIGLFLLLAAGCATTDDPRQGGLFSYNPATYEARLEQRRQNLTTLQQNQRQEEEQARQLEREAQSRQARLESENARLRRLDDELVQLQQNINQYQKNINKYQARTNKQQAEKQRLGREFKRLQDQILDLKNNQQLAEIDKQKQIEGIKREIDELKEREALLKK